MQTQLLAPPPGMGRGGSTRSVWSISKKYISLMTFASGTAPARKKGVCTLSSAKFPFANYFSIYRKHHVKEERKPSPIGWCCSRVFIAPTRKDDMESRRPSNSAWKFIICNFLQSSWPPLSCYSSPVLVVTIRVLLAPHAQSPVVYLVCSSLVIDLKSYFSTPLRSLQNHSSHSGRSLHLSFVARFGPSHFWLATTNR